jgi:hypothetical protein
VALVSQQYAKRRGISQAAVWKRTTAAGGPIPTHGPRKLIDPDEADGLWEPTQSPQGAGGATNGRPAPTGSPLASARAAAVVLDVRLRQLQLDQRRGALISRDRAVVKAFSFARTLRDMIQAWPARAGPALAARFEIDDVAAFVVAVEDGMRSLLDDLASERVEF